MPYIPRTGDPLTFGADDPKAGALSMSVPLYDYDSVSTEASVMFARQDAFRTVAEAIAGGIATVPFDLYERDTGNGRAKVSDFQHPVAAALAEPTVGVTQYRWIESLMLDHILHDRWAALITTEEDGSIELLRLPAQWISFGVDAFRRIKSVVLQWPNADEYEIPINRVMFDVGYDPRPSGKKTRGLPVARTLRTPANELEKGSAYRNAILTNGPKVPMYVFRPKDAPDWIKNGGYDRFKQDFATYDTENAGKAPVLQDGMELRAAPQLDEKSVEYRETRKAAQIEFAISLHYPPELVGYREGNFSNIGALREQLYVDVLGGRIMAFRQATNAGLYRAGVLERARYYVEENVGIRLQGNPVLQASILQTQTGAPIRTVNESRKLFNLPPVDGGDELIVPLNVTKGGLASPTDTAPKTLARGHRMLALPSGAKATTPKTYVDAIDAMVDRFATDLSKAFTAQADRIKSVLGDGNAPGPLADAFDTERENAELAAAIIPHSYAIALAGAQVVLDQYNPDSEGFDPELMQPWLSKAALGDAAAINSGTYDTLASKINDPEWKTAIDEALASLALAGAALWARTIATTSDSFGGQDAAKRSGLTHKTWIHRSSASPRAEHAALNGQTVRVDETFSNGMRWPGDPFGGAANNAECHCRVEYTVRED